MGYSKILFLELEETIWSFTDYHYNAIWEYRTKLLSRVYNIKYKETQNAIEYLFEIIKRYKKHFKVPSPEKQLELVFNFLKIPISEISDFYDMWFEAILKFQPSMDFTFISTLGKLLQTEKGIFIVGYCHQETEEEKYIRELLSISGFLHLFQRVLTITSMNFIPPSPLAFMYPQLLPSNRYTIALATRTDTLKSLLTAGYKNIFLWDKNGTYNGVFDTINDYHEIITKIANL